MSSLISKAVHVHCSRAVTTTLPTQATVTSQLFTTSLWSRCFF